MNKKEFKELTYTLIPTLKEKLKGKASVHTIQDNLNDVHPFSQPEIFIGIAHIGTTLKEVFSVTNNGEEVSWKFVGHTQ